MVALPAAAAASSAHRAPLLHSARVSMRTSTRCFAGSAVCAALLQGKGHQALTPLPPLGHHQLIYDLLAGLQHSRSAHLSMMCISPHVLPHSIIMYSSTTLMVHCMMQWYCA